MQRSSTLTGRADTMPGMRGSARRVGVTVAMLAAAAVPAIASPASARAPRFASADGLRVLGVQRLDPRSYDVQVASADLGRPVHVRVLLPVRYAQHPRSRYPV